MIGLEAAEALPAILRTAIYIAQAVVLQCSRTLKIILKTFLVSLFFYIPQLILLIKILFIFVLIMGLIVLYGV